MSSLFLLKMKIKAMKSLIPVPRFRFLNLEAEKAKWNIKSLQQSIFCYEFKKKKKKGKKAVDLVGQ